MAPSAITPPPSEATITTKTTIPTPSSTPSCPPHMLSKVHIPINNEDYKSYTMSMPNNLRGMMNSGSLVLGMGCMIPSVDAARVIATLPHQFCWLDCEHTSYDPHTLTQMIRTVRHVSQGKMGVICRIPQSNPDLVTYALNAGASGILFPHIQNVEQAQNLANLCRFPPNGLRGYPPFTLFGDEKNTGVDGKNIFDVWDENVCVIAQIEDPEGVKNVEEICAVPGIDALMVGCHDLRMEMGIRPPGAQDGEEPEFLAALDKITNAAAKHGENGMAILSFSRLGPDMMKRLRRGWRAFKINTDVFEIHKQGMEQYEKVTAVGKMFATPVEEEEKATEAVTVTTSEIVVDPLKIANARATNPNVVKQVTGA